MNPGSALVNYLREQVPERRHLTTQMASDGRVSCYYLCAFSTLRRIIVEGIKCRHSTMSALDLSSPDVQYRRGTMSLGRWENGTIRKSWRGGQVMEGRVAVEGRVAGTVSRLDGRVVGTYQRFKPKTA